MHLAVGLRPQADASTNALQINCTPNKACRRGNLRPWCWRSGARGRAIGVMASSIANPFHRGAPVFLELPQNEVVVERVGAAGQIVAVRLEVEQDSRPLVGAAGNAFE